MDDKHKNNSRLENIVKKVKNFSKAGLLAAGLAIGYNGYSQVPGLPINYWDSPVGCATCNPSRGVLRDGLHFLDGSLVEMMMDCDGNGSKETNVNKSQFQNTLMNGAYNVDVYAESNECGYNPINPSRNKGDIRVAGTLMNPRDLALTDEGASVQQKLEVYELNLAINHSLSLSSTSLNWSPGTLEANISGGGYDVIRGDVANLKASQGLGNANVEQLGCYLPATSLSGLSQLDANPSTGSAYFYLVRPRNSMEKGNYGLGKDNLPRQNPAANDCI